MTKLNQNKLNYILFHLGQSIKITPFLKENIIYREAVNEHKNKIIFLSSSSDFYVDQIFSIDNIPILFPLNYKNEWYTIDNNNNLVFNHDILKSAFYLLSEYQINKIDEPYDNLSRFKYKESLQYQLEIIQIPVVNYYFEIVANGIKEYCSIHNIDFEKRKLFDPFAFMHTHDVDRVDQYHFWEVALKVLQLIGNKPNPYKDKKTIARVTLDYVLNFLRIKNSSNNFWNFKNLRNIERKYGLKSVFYFLDNEGLHDNSRYDFREKRIIELIQYLHEEKCEIGIHGTLQAADDAKYANQSLKKLQSVSPQKVIGNRQHYLKLKNPETLKIIEKLPLEYDSSMGFAEHEGFRNSYCLPFKPYDFVNDCMMDIWEIPLNAMDVTLTSYRNLEYQEILASVRKLINETKKFGGVFTLLWHNCHFDENLFPGINEFYQILLKEIVSYNPLSLTGKDIIQKMENN